METSTHISIITKTNILVKYCIISATIAFAITLLGKINVYEFMMNILDWQSM